MSTITGVLIPADDDQTLEVVKFDRSDYRNFQKYVGGVFEIIESRSLALSLLVNEEGKILNLPLNVRATEFLYGRCVEFVGYDVLNGDVLVLGGADDEGNTLSIPEHVIDWLINNCV